MVLEAAGVALRKGNDERVKRDLHGLLLRKGLVQTSVQVILHMFDSSNVSCSTQQISSTGHGILCIDYKEIRSVPHFAC